jgi:hypothetical protein
VRRGRCKDDRRRLDRDDERQRLGLDGRHLGDDPA